ncbi:MAG TPA: phosphopantetheine-binding protein, partial [Micromonosporaceae bacterium]
HARLARTGIAPLTADQGLALFDTVIADTLSDQPTTQIIASRWDTAALRDRLDNGQPVPAVLRSLVRPSRRQAAPGEPAPSTSTSTSTGATGAGTPGGLAARLIGLAETDARTLMTDVVRGHVAAVLAHSSPSDVDADRAFSELGFDSLTAVELRNRLNAETGLRLPATLVFDHPTVSQLAEYLHRTLAPAAPAPDEVLREALDRVQALVESDAGGRARVVTVLQAALTRLGGDVLDVGVELNQTSDEELFAFIDSQL